MTTLTLLELLSYPLQISRPVTGLTAHVEGGESWDVVLYVGLGMIAVGLVITVVGLGDKGFKAFELKVVGPSIVLCGGLLSCLRILVCIVPQWDCVRKWRDPGRGEGETLLHGEQHTELSEQ